MSVEEKFIERLKDFQILYDRRKNHVEVLGERDAIWANLTKEFNFNAKKKYQNMRDKFGREKRKELLALQSGNEFTSSWRHYEALNGILSKYRKPNLQNTKKIKIQKAESINENEMNELINDFCHDDSEEINSNDDSENDLNDLTNNLKTDPFEVSFQDEISKSIRKQSQINKTHIEKDEDSVFLELLAIKMKKMSLSEKSDFQLEILKRADQIVIKK